MTAGLAEAFREWPEGTRQSVAIPLLARGLSALAVAVGRLRERYDTAEIPGGPRGGGAVTVNDTDGDQMLH